MGGEGEMLKGPANIKVVGSDEGLKIGGADQGRERAGEERLGGRTG